MAHTQKNKSVNECSQIHICLHGVSDGSDRKVGRVVNEMEAYLEPQDKVSSL